MDTTYHDSTNLTYYGNDKAYFFALQHFICGTAACKAITAEFQQLRDIQGCFCYTPKLITENNEKKMTSAQKKKKKKKSLNAIE